MNKPPDVGYTDQALDARIGVLQGAFQTLGDSTIRREYDQSFRVGEILEDVPEDYFAGTLALLQEGGDYQTVVGVGEAWLTQHPRHKSASDVALATALAHCDIAKRVLESRGRVEQALSALESAGRLLNTYRTGTPELAGQVDEAAGDLRAQLTLELLSSSDAATQERGLEYLPAALEAVASRVGAGEEAARRRHQMTRTQYLQNVGELLTAEQQIALYEQVGDLFASTPAELYTVAVAYIAAGAAGAKPALLRKATEVLQAAEAAGEAEERFNATEESSQATQAMVLSRRLADEGHRRAVASCVAWLLLGDSAAAGDALGLTDGRIKCDRQVMHFIRSNSPEANSLLPGVCGLVQRWVADVALKSFLTEGEVFNSGNFTLDNWFENAQVVKELEESSAGRGLIGILTAPIRALAGLFLSNDKEPNNNKSAGGSNANNTASESGGDGARTRVQEPPVSVLAAAARVHLQDNNNNNERTTARQGASSSTSSRPAVAAKAASTPVPAPIFPAPEASAPPSVPPRSARGTPLVTEPQAAPPPRPSAPEEEAKVPQPEPTLESALAAFEDEVDASDAAAGPLQGQTRIEKERKTSLGDEQFLEQPVSLESIKPLQGEDDWMRRAYEPRNIRWGRVAAAAAVFGGTGLLIARSALFPQTLPIAAHAPDPSIASSASSSATSSTAASVASAAQHVSMSHNEAVSLIKQWQKIKAAALGKEHSLTKLSTVLSGDLLGQWYERAAALQAKGWYYTHSLHSSKVEKVAAGPLPGTATIIAAFNEGVTVHKGIESGADEGQTFVSEYKVVYQAVRGEKGGWVLTSAMVEQK